MLEKILGFILLFLSQFAGGPGPVENNLVRFGLPAVLWGILLYIAWSRQRTQDLPREKLLVWGFGLAFIRETYMFGQMAWRLLGSGDVEATCDVIQPLEHGLAMAAMIVVAGAFLRYILEDAMIARRYLQIGIGTTLLVFVFTSWTWPRQLAAFPQIKFHQTWAAWLFHIPLAILMGTAVVLLWKKRGWLRNVVATALTFYLISELLLLLNYATARAYNAVICPIGNSLHILAIPLLGYVYLHEQSLEKKQAEEALKAYRDHLEELVSERTAELTAVNAQLTQEVDVRTQAEEALERITRRDELILEAAGEGICGIDRQGRVIFANPAAARMLGYLAAEMINQASHALWHPTRTDGKPHTLAECPIYQGYSQGIQRYGDDEYFWRRDGTGFPVRYFSNPTREKDELAGVVLVFQDITERKRSEAEIAQRNASLATQNAVAAALSQSLELEEHLKNVLEMVRVDAEMEFGLIFLSNPESGSLQLQLHSGLRSSDGIRAFNANECVCQQISNQALYRNQAVTTNLKDVPHDQRCPCRNQSDIRSLTSVPLVSKGKPVGVITLGSQQDPGIQKHKMDLLTAIGQQIGMAVENARLYRDAENWAEDLSRLHEASSFLAESLDPVKINKEIARQSARLLKCQKSCVIHTNFQAQALEMAAYFGLDPDEVQALEDFLPRWTALFNLASQLKITTVREAGSDEIIPQGLKKRLRLQSALFVPIWSGDNPQELLILMDSTSARSWRARDLELMESLANRSAVALMNARLHQQLELAAALEERQRIAANMHDGLAQTLSLLGLRVDHLQDLVEDGSSPDADVAINDIRDTVVQASAEVRRSIARLQESPRRRRSLQDLLSNLLNKLRTNDGPEIGFDPDLTPALFPTQEQAEQLLPVIQEAVLNACHHAQAKTISIYLENTEDQGCITIEDDGVGFDLNTPRQDGEHFGLSIMQARAARIGGNFHVVSLPGSGTKVRLSWPFDQQENRNPGISH